MTRKLYIIMREDLYDNSSGKMMAQSAHAQANFEAYFRKNMKTLEEDYGKWCEDRNFGVTLVLTAPKNEWMDIASGVSHYGYVEDPTYPYRNHYGKLFTACEDTCMWVFTTTDQEVEHMQRWNLHP